MSLIIKEYYKAYQSGGWSGLGYHTGQSLGEVGLIYFTYQAGKMMKSTLSTAPSGLNKSAINSGVKKFVSDSHRIQNHVLVPKHKLIGFTAKSAGKLAKQTLTYGTISPYGVVSIATFGSAQVTFRIIGKAIHISNLWFM